MVPKPGTMATGDELYSPEQLDDACMETPNRGSRDINFVRMQTSGIPESFFSYQCCSKAEHGRYLFTV